MIAPPGKSACIIGPSGTGKSTLCASAARYHESGIIITVPGSDEIESYREFYEEAAYPIWSEDGTAVEIPDARYIIAPFDDVDFAPSLGRAEGLVADAQKRLVFFLRAVRQLIQEDVQAGKEPRWGVLIQDTFSGINTLSVNAVMTEMRVTQPPGAKSPDGAAYYGNLQNRMNDVARASRVLKGLGMDWIATSHVKITDVSDAAKQGKTVASTTQYMPLMTGAFREQFTPIFDMVLHSEVGVGNKYQLRHDADMKRQAKMRGLKEALTPDGFIINDWPTILAAYEKASG